MLKDKVLSVRDRDIKPTILVIGDLMVDHYIWGQATRLSPEAPVPVVNVKNESTTLGGAGNVTQNLVSLGADVILAGIVGDDMQGTQLKEILQAEHVATDCIVTDNSRPTTVKTRVLAGSHQLVRIDREVTDEISLEVEDELAGKIIKSMDAADIVIFSDYNKGVFSQGLTQRLLQAAGKAQKKVIVDPKGLNYAKYKGAYLIKPNRKELAEAAKLEKIGNIGDLQEAAKTIFAQTQTDYLVVTLSEEGMVILTELAYKALPVKATEVFDVTGAGDTVLAAIAYFLAAGFSVEEACEVSNHAAAIVIRQVGSASATIDEILADMAG
ncbi:D-glycero-beta-D-manno-heptose-7-phosphate kinase [Mucilaginibacter calamicampi]|uniref:D-glycero-beta-D-manno-heptose-7-phosphate kinase n=1 Tax=Mucilaginibacter calamicampi TaxID=1302352 RepID=A0ABW2YZS5_9SPHI